MDKKGYKIYAKIRNKIYKLMDKYDVDVVLDAIADTLVDIMGDDAIEFIEESLKVSKELEEEE